MNARKEDEPGIVRCIWFLRSVGGTLKNPLTLYMIILFTILMIILLKTLVSSHEEDMLPLPDQDIPEVKQDNPELIAYIKQLHIKGPSGKPYNLTKPQLEDPSQNGQGRIIANIFKEMRGGTFLEAGAYNGEEYSNTLYLERNLGWRGLLVEPDPWNFWALRKRSRKAHSIHACLSPFRFPREVTFRQSDTFGHISDSVEAKRKGIFTRVKCFPLYSLMLAQNLTKLDFLSLDIEGSEIEVLETLPWKKIDIKVILVEHTHVPLGKTILSDLLSEKNYSLNSSVGDDLVFVKR